MAGLETIEGIDLVYAGKLREAGVHSLEALLRAAATPQGRRKLEQETGIGQESILDWVNRADLMRVRGIGTEYSDLLERAGVDTVCELRQRNPGHLYETLLRVNAEQRLVVRLPGRSMVDRWVALAGDLPGEPDLPPK